MTTATAVHVDITDRVVGIIIQAGDASIETVRELLTIEVDFFTVAEVQIAPLRRVEQTMLALCAAPLADVATDILTFPMYAIVPQDELHGLCKEADIVTGFQICAYASALTARGLLNDTCSVNLRFDTTGLTPTASESLRVYEHRLNTNNYERRTLTFHVLTEIAKAHGVVPTYLGIPISPFAGLGCEVIEEGTSRD